MDPGTRRGRRAVVVGGLALLAGAAVLFVAGRTGTERAAPPPITAADPATVYDPVVAGEPLPAGYLPILDRDQIQPVYHPAFVPAERVDWPGGMLVIGVAGERTAKAYPVTHLNKHEMVIDRLEGTPILVSW